MQFDLYSAIYAILIAFIINIFLCPIIIPFLTRLKFGQNVRDDGPQSHLIKSGTPTMGGIMILISLVISSLFFLKGNKDGIAVLFVTIGYGIIGFIDDYIKVVKKRSLGLRAYQKIIGQIIITGVFLYYLYNYSNVGTDVYIPFTNGKTLELGILFIPFFFIVMVGTVNSVNLTDGLDGLASGVTVLVVIFFLFNALAINKSLLPITGAAVGALLGFLLFNTHPAKVFMGDTGSLALGGLVASIAIIMKMPLFIIIVGIIYVLEAVSVMLQVGYFRLTKGKRLFKMAPIHHHFEQCGWKEVKVVAVFYIITAMACLVGFLATKNFF
ncbi:phospho-N-acetylmuramoyl-pentapeptide-transferase [uncultured Tyzzerella sp.]|uniref:phospho-N-acetylmuramoyl-pentapeptide- transferase n=1 Tax=uncultured Tyzzerella sp. TaxID=2321398 RepID=UPI0029420136|nr:phospho-N-acetylmuramoyl-pentapeptide-transferase [uncultured Tyzzerella sp.]